MNALDSRLTCEHCRGTGYIITALGKLPCLTCSASEVSNRQDQSEVVRNRREAMLVEELCPVAKNSTDFSRSIASRLIFGVGRLENRTVVQVFAVALDDEPGIPFAHIKVENVFKYLDGNCEFVGRHVGIGVGEVLLARIFAAEKNFDFNWTVVYALQKLQGVAEPITVPIGEAIQETKKCS